MREIKFRAYNPRDKKMHYDITGFEFFGDGNMSGVFIDGVFFLIEEVELMQYTGLHDKNEKEIYEGDIISDLDYGIMICKFINGSFVWQSIKNELYIKFFTYIPIVEVIGNIYDNPDLLEKGAEE